MKKYMLKTQPTDHFYWTMSFKEFRDNISIECDGKYAKSTIEEIENSLSVIYYIMEDFFNEHPKLISIFGIPKGNSCELVIIAKIDNNGTTCFFSDNLEFLKLISKDCETSELYELYGEIKRRNLKC